jgi:Flp pilus assembly protein TadG
MGSSRVTRSGWSLARFRRDEDGAIVIFSLFLFLIIVSLGAIGVDLMRFEMERAKLQSTMDRAVLAAADMDQNLDPRSVLNDYFEKSGFAGAVTDVKLQERTGYRAVNATARSSIDTQLIHMFGVDNFSVPAAGGAELRLDAVEISLVLDISGSMGFGGRLPRLRTAANEFIDAIFINDALGKVSMSLVPYNGQINLGPDLISKYNITHRHPANTCVDLPESVYDSAALPRNLPMSQHAHADTRNFSPTNDPYNTAEMLPLTTDRWCYERQVNHVQVLSNNPARLKQNVMGMQAIGPTSIDAGLRWGSALLDPSARSVVTDLIAENKVTSRFAGRPLDYNPDEVLKILVLMTDGENWPNEFVNPNFKIGMSPIWRDRRDGLLSIHHPGVAGPNKYWAPHVGQFFPHMWGGSSVEDCSTTPCTRVIDPGFADQLTWEQVWQHVRVRWVANQLYRRALGGRFDDWLDMLRTREGVVAWHGNDIDRMNARTLRLCNAVKEKGVVIYTIAFEATQNGTTLLRDCASSPNHAFEVSGIQISGAFSSIAKSIGQLKLVQ